MRKSHDPSRSDTEQLSYQKTVLPNGIRIVSETIPYVRSVSIGVWANVGSRDETQPQNGISHFLEHMVFKGTRKRSVREIAQSLESLGGYLNAFTTKEQTCFYARVLDEHVPQALDVLSDILLNPAFKETELEKERQVVIEELRNAEDDPDDVIHDYFEKSIFPAHSLGFPIVGTEANVRRFGRKDLTTHLGTYYIPPNLVLAAAGNIPHQTFVEYATKYFGSVRGEGHQAVRTPGPWKNPKPEHKEYSRQINQAHICLGTVAYGIKHKNRYPLLILNALLGEGMSSRLYQTIREEHGLAYTVYSFVNMLSDTGAFGVYVGTDKRNIENSIKLIYRELARLKAKPVPRSELERTRSQIKGTMMLSLENMSGRMMRLGSSELYFQSFMSLDSILRKVDAVTPEAIQQVANDLFDEEQFSSVVIRPSG
jgi:predicted Zn-dependent peptidase